MPLFNLPESPQEVYNIVAQHMLKQNAKSLAALSNGGIGCAYRGRNGLKCAAGCLIPDEVYNCRIEDITWFNLVNDHDFPQCHRALISDLQRIHDNYEPDCWRKHLIDLASDHSLNTDVLTK